MKLTHWNHNFAASPNWKDKLAVSPIKHRKQKAPDFFRIEQKRLLLVWDRNFWQPDYPEHITKLILETWGLGMLMLMRWRSRSVP